MSAASRRLARRRAAVGRGAAWGLEDLGDQVTRCRVLEHGATPPGVWMAPGTVVAEVWAHGDPEPVAALIESRTPAHVDVVVVVRRPRRWHRWAAWWRALRVGWRRKK